MDIDWSSNPEPETGGGLLILPETSTLFGKKVILIKKEVCLCLLKETRLNISGKKATILVMLQEWKQDFENES